MRREMRRVAFNVALIVSLGILALLALGFFGRIGMLIRRVGPTVTSPYREHDVTLDDGRFMIWTQTWPTTPPTHKLDTITIEPRVKFRLRFPNSHALGGFDAHPLAFSSGQPILYLIACPIWA